MSGGGTGFLSVATVRRPHGIRGEIVVSLETDRPKVVFRPGRSLRLGDASGRPTGGAVTVDRARPFKDGMLVKLVEHDQLTPEVDGLRGRTLLIPLEEAAPAAEDEVRYHELVGLAVQTADGEIGKVERVVEMAGGELLSIRRRGGKELLVPFVKEMVRSVNLTERVIEIDPPEGLLDL